MIPFSYYTNKKDKSDFVFLNETISKIGGSFSGYLKVNPNFDSFYLTNYPEEKWIELSNQMTNSLEIVNSLTVNDRVDLLISAYLLNQAKLTPHQSLLNMFNYLVNEKHFVPWNYFEL